MRAATPSLLALAADLGITISLCASEVTWDPATRTLFLRPAPGSVLDQVAPGVEDALDEMLEHELGHYAVATPEERGRVDWGLGIDTNRVGVRIEEVVEMHGGQPVVVQRAVQRPGSMTYEDAQVVEAAVWLWQQARGRDFPFEGPVAELALGTNRRSRAAWARFAASDNIC